jgi:hypothetical protein
MGVALIGICILGSAVKPRLRAREMPRESLHYFGNVRAYWPLFWPLRHRSERIQVGRAEFDIALKNAANDTNYEARLDDQIWFLGRIAFRKYRLITVSLWAFAGAIFLALLGLLLEKH